MDTVEQALDEWRRERPDLDPSPIGVFGRLRRVAELSRHELETYLSPHGLTPKSFDVLANLRRGGPPYRKTPSELAESSLLSSGAMTGRLDSLERAGLICRTPHPSDRRVMFAELTPAGIELIDDVFALHLENEEALLDGLTAEERAGIVAALVLLEGTMLATVAERTVIPPRRPRRTAG
ncbi:MULTISPECIES: MarR family winged helix-turn-helix transcriptional regulator [Thermomonosporaceae]|uniref:MarR family winged helix-turn-helix transcriptional regulator n=1 Tax=Thermomonosporaceae TaxID=2012 RepID=UPI00255AEC42|nr:MULTISPECIES: MarR family transcriptional regulator [Thermomonosporaceae]MDL4771684.1 MarR family transcriptional regulator [Actinomadura xylanilytica]